MSKRQKSFAERMAEGFAAMRAEQAIRRKQVASGTVPLPLAKPKGKTYTDKRAIKKARIKGEPVFIAPIKKVHGARGKPPSEKRIAAWVNARRNVKHWRNRDGSYQAIATFKGKNAWNKATTAASRIPLSAYCAFRYEIKENLAVERTGVSKSSDPSEAYGTRLVVESTPTVRAEHWGLSYGHIFAGYDAEEANDRFLSGVYLRRAGLAVLWPSPDAPPKPKKYRRGKR